MTFQARTSYLPNEIMWGHRFEPMMIYRKDHNKYQVRGYIAILGLIGVLRNHLKSSWQT